MLALAGLMTGSGGGIGGGGVEGGNVVVSLQ
jgi:hypothetical protein